MISLLQVIWFDSTIWNDSIIQVCLYSNTLSDQVQPLLSIVLLCYMHFPYWVPLHYRIFNRRKGRPVISLLVLLGIKKIDFTTFNTHCIVSRDGLSLFMGVGEVKNLYCGVLYCVTCSPYSGQHTIILNSRSLRCFVKSRPLFSVKSKRQIIYLPLPPNVMKGHCSSLFFYQEFSWDFKCCAVLFF